MVSRSGVLRQVHGLVVLMVLLVVLMVLRKLLHLLSLLLIHSLIPAKIRLAISVSLLRHLSRLTPNLIPIILRHAESVIDISRVAHHTWLRLGVMHVLCILHQARVRYVSCRRISCVCRVAHTWTLGGIRLSIPAPGGRWRR